MWIRIESHQQKIRSTKKIEFLHVPELAPPLILTYTYFTASDIENIMALHVESYFSIPSNNNIPSCALGTTIHLVCSLAAVMAHIYAITDYAKLFSHDVLYITLHHKSNSLPPQQTFLFYHHNHIVHSSYFCHYFLLATHST